MRDVEGHTGEYHVRALALLLGVFYVQNYWGVE